jgi:DNA-binding CsgD family transcriptional regulator
LSYREREVLHWIAAGKSIPAVAEILNVSGHTARDYVKSAMRKLNATTQAQAVAIGVRLGEILP